MLNGAHVVFRDTPSYKIIIIIFNYNYITVLIFLTGKKAYLNYDAFFSLVFVANFFFLILKL